MVLKNKFLARFTFNKILIQFFFQTGKYIRVYYRYVINFFQEVFILIFFPRAAHKMLQMIFASF